MLVRIGDEIKLHFLVQNIVYSFPHKDLYYDTLFFMKIILLFR